MQGVYKLNDIDTEQLVGPACTVRVIKVRANCGSFAAREQCTKCKKIKHTHTLTRVFS